MITPLEYIDNIKNHLIDNQRVAKYQFVFERATEDSAFVRARVYLTDQSILHFSEYSELNEDGVLSITTYSYHWMTADKGLVRRWDNTAHYPQLPGFPHHLHDGDEKNVLPSEPMNLFKVLEAITTTIRSSPSSATIPETSDE